MTDTPEPATAPQPQSPPTAHAYRWLRFAVAAFMVVLVLAMFPWTNNPTGDIKELILGWAAVGLAVMCLIVSLVQRIPLERPRVFAIPLLLETRGNERGRRS